MKISVIMPTGNRLHLLPMAINCYVSQDWPDKELIVVDDGEESAEDLFAGIPNVVYIRPDPPAPLPAKPRTIRNGIGGRLIDVTEDRSRMSIGAKRNLACERATGEIICNFDDDDWYGHDVISDQVGRLIKHDKQVAGYHSVFFWNMLTNKSYEQIGDPFPPEFLSGMCFRRSFWEHHPFEDTFYAEHYPFLFAARDARAIVSADGRQRFVIRTHGKNITGALDFSKSTEAPRGSLPAGFLQAIQSRESE